MNFQEALAQLREGKVVRRAEWNNGEETIGIPLACVFNRTTNVVEWVDDCDAVGAVDFLMEDFLATDWEVVPEVLPTLTEEQAYLYFDPEKARWVSTTNPQRHIDRGHRVAVFQLNRAV